MEICHVTSSHNRYDGRILKKECVSLAKKYNVTLLCADNQKEEMYDNVKIVPLGFKPKNRFERFFKTSGLIYKKALEIDALVYHLHDPELLSISLKLKQNGKIVVFDSHEDYPSNISQKAWIPKYFRKFVSKLYEIKEKKILKKLDGVVTITPKVNERILKYNKNTFMVTNYPIIEKLLLKVKDKKALCFAGGVASQWMHHKVIEAIKDLNVSYVIAGDTNGDYFKSLEKLDGFKNVITLGKVTKNRVKELYATSSIGIALNDYVANVGYKEGSLGNTKIFEYMEAGLPIVGTDFRIWKEIIAKNKCGICVNPRNTEEIKKAIEYLINNPKESEKMGQNGRKLVEKYYNWNTQEQILYDLYKKLEEESQ